jgi:hypothetical protein
MFERGNPQSGVKKRRVNRRAAVYKCQLRQFRAGVPTSTIYAGQEDKPQVKPRAAVYKCHCCDNVRRLYGYALYATVVMNVQRKKSGHLSFAKP